MQRREQAATLVARREFEEDNAAATFVVPRIYGINSLQQLQEEVFGPILHVIRYPADQLNAVLSDNNRSGYGLTLGVHSRIESFAQHVFAHA